MNKSSSAKAGAISPKSLPPFFAHKKVQSLEDVFECSVNMDIRILWTYREGKIILLINIGNHDII